MKKVNVLLALVVLLAAGAGCGVRKKDRCPQVGQANHGIFEKK